MIAMLIGPALVQAAQGLSALAWLVEAIWFGLAARRLIRATSPLSAFAVLLSFMGWGQVGFVVRWYVWRGAVGAMSDPELAWWTTLYLLMVIIALGLVGAGETYRRYSP